jgi:hypothetical protein
MIHSITIQLAHARVVSSICPASASAPSRRIIISRTRTFDAACRLQLASSEGKTPPKPSVPVPLRPSRTPRSP